MENPFKKNPESRSQEPEARSQNRETKNQKSGVGIKKNVMADISDTLSSASESLFLQKEEGETWGNQPQVETQPVIQKPGIFTFFRFPLFWLLTRAFYFFFLLLTPDF
jgi:hypothetical protein